MVHFASRILIEHLGNGANVVGVMSAVRVTGCEVGSSVHKQKKMFPKKNIIKYDYREKRFFVV